MCNNNDTAMYWRYVEDLYHLQNGLRNWIDYYQGRQQKLTNVLRVVIDRFSCWQGDGPSLQRALLASKEVCIERVAAAEELLLAHAGRICNSFVLGTHLAEVDDAVKTGVLSNQHNI